MKKIEKTFWVSDSLVSYMNYNEETDCYRSFAISNNRSGDCQTKVTIVMEEPEKTVTISESEFNEAVKYADNNYTQFNSYIPMLKQKLFGGSND